MRDIYAECIFYLGLVQDGTGRTERRGQIVLGAAAISGVAQSQTRLKRLSSSSSRNPNIKMNKNKSVPLESDPEWASHVNTISLSGKVFRFSTNFHKNVKLEE